MDDDADVLQRAARAAAAFRGALGERRVFPEDLDVAALREGFGELRDAPTPPAAVLDELMAAADHGLVATPGPRYFGFVVGGSLTSAAAADVLTTGWDQPAYNATSSPSAAMVEEVAGSWLLELLGLPSTASFGFVTGGQGANTVCLAAARHEVLSRAGWDVGARGLVGAPALRVVATAERHATVDRSLRLLGLGDRCLEPVPTDANGAILVEELRRVLHASPPAPTIVCLQAGNVNTGAIDDLATATDVAHEVDAWVHVDGAIGLWAAASPSYRRLVDGVERADSWGTDGHKWLNVPYDSGYAFTAHREAHAAAVAYDAAYLSHDASRAPGDYVLESSRRARGFATWAALRELGRLGVADLVDRCCAHARRFAEQLDAVDGIEVVNDVVLNQVLVRFGDDVTTDRVLEQCQRSGVCWMGATSWHGMRLMRLALSNHRTSSEDVDRSVAAILEAHARVLA